MKDRIEKGEFKVSYCPTEYMLADFFTKPLQGGLFKKVSATIMGEVDLFTFMNDNHNTHESKERVGQTQIPDKNEHICDVNINGDSRVIDTETGTSQPTHVMSYADAVRNVQK